MKGKVFALVAFLALAVLIAGCGEKAGEAMRSLSPQPDPPGVQFLRNDLTAVSSSLEKLTDAVAITNNKCDSLLAQNAAQDVEITKLKADNAVLKADWLKFANAANGKFDLLRVKTGIAGSDFTKWETYPLLTGYSWSGASR